MPKPQRAEYGLYDTIDHCWMGNHEGPLVYDSPTLAQVSATILNERFGYVSRIQSRPYDGSGTQFKDEQTPKRSFEQAMLRLER